MFSLFVPKFFFSNFIQWFKRRCADRVFPRISNIGHIPGEISILRELILHKQYTSFTCTPILKGLPFCVLNSFQEKNGERFFFKTNPNREKNFLIHLLINLLYFLIKEAARQFTPTLQIMRKK